MAPHEEDEDLSDVDPPTCEPYTVLGIEKTATADEIKSAYRKAALKHHPGRTPCFKPLPFQHMPFTSLQPCRRGLMFTTFFISTKTSQYPTNSAPQQTKLPPTSKTKLKSNSKNSHSPMPFSLTPSAESATMSQAPPQNPWTPTVISPGLISTALNTLTL